MSKGKSKLSALALRAHRVVEAFIASGECNTKLSDVRQVRSVRAMREQARALSKSPRYSARDACYEVCDEYPRAALVAVLCLSCATEWATWNAERRAEALLSELCNLRLCEGETAEWSGDY